ncbi:MAG: hypothetical protein KA304_07865, partial [Aeromonas sp.]|nr:hypothetical protein [Aeromonas sp.]
ENHAGIRSAAAITLLLATHDEGNCGSPFLWRYLVLIAHGKPDRSVRQAQHLTVRHTAPFPSDETSALIRTGQR